jgi:ATP-dependent DNA helicase DinG
LNRGFYKGIFIMSEILVAIDLEFTGLDPANAEIIEIGAAKFQGGEIVDTFSTLVDPGTAIPQRVTDITHITDADVRGAPSPRDAVKALVDFVGDAPLVGHNIESDMRFLRKYEALTSNATIDTYELAAFLLPTAMRYNLNALMQAVGISSDGQYHRALTDAAATGKLYHTLRGKLAHGISASLLREIAALGKDRDWKANPAIQSALQERGDALKDGADPVAAVLHHKVDFPPLLAPHTKSEDLPTEVVDQMLSQHTANAEAYQKALPLAHTTAFALNRGEHMMVEAGQEDPLGYLIPAAQFATLNGECVLIATGTEARRGQLQSRLEALQKAMPELRVAFLRRRAEYLCPSQLRAMRQQPPANLDELRMLAKTLVWLGENGPQKDSNIAVRSPGEHLAWGQLNAALCAPSRCQALTEGACALYQQTRLAQSAHLVVVDHKALVSEFGVPESLLPSFQHLIIDEAHMLEDNATEAMHHRLDAARLKRATVALGDQHSGLLGAVLAQTQPAIPEKSYQTLAAGIEATSAAVHDWGDQVDRFFREVVRFLEKTAQSQPGEFSVTVHLNKALRQQAAAASLKSAWATLREYMETISSLLPQLTKRLATLREKYSLPSIGDVITDLEHTADQVNRNITWLDAFINGDEQVSWFEYGTESLLLHRGVHDAGNLLNSAWKACKSALVLGSPLQVGGSFNFAVDRFNAELFTTADLRGKDESALLVTVITDMPDVKEQEKYGQLLERTVIEVCSVVEGRVMVVFTGMGQLRAAAGHITARMGLGNIPVIDQSDGSSMSMLLENFLSLKRAVLLATRGGWEEAVFPEDSLAALVAVRLPFPVPNEPIFATRCEGYPNAYEGYTLPLTVTRFGRMVAPLLHGKKHRALVVLDKRVLARDNGATFLGGLRAATIDPQPAAMAHVRVKKWLTST